MPTININNNRFNLLELNENSTETVLLIHGIFTNLSVYYFSIAQELAQKYRVVLYDLKGHGLSEAANSGYDLASMSEDLLGIIKELKLSKVHLVAYSYGGLVAMHTALHHPDVLNKLVIIETPNLNDGQFRKLLHGYDKDYLDQYLQELSISTSMTPSARKIAKTHKQVQYLFEHTSLKDDLQKDLNLFEDIKKNPFSAETLLLYATHSDCDNAAKFLQKHLQKASLFYGEGDHSIPVQNPQWISQKIINFL